MHIVKKQNNTIFANQMIKKGANILAVLITSIILLAHAVVPHHHHNLQVCVTENHIHHEDGTHEHSCAGENHKHDHKTDDLSCILKKIVMFRPGHSEQNDKFILSSDDEINSFFITVFSNSEKNGIYSAELNNISPPDIKKVYTSQVIKSFGLRAPPVV